MVVQRGRRKHYRFQKHTTSCAKKNQEGLGLYRFRRYSSSSFSSEKERKQQRGKGRFVLEKASSEDLDSLRRTLHNEKKIFDKEGTIMSQQNPAGSPPEEEKKKKKKKKTTTTTTTTTTTKHLCTYSKNNAKNKIAHTHTHTWTL